MNYYLLTRYSESEEIETQVVSCPEGSDPLYGNGSWDVGGGPYPSMEMAEEASRAWNTAHYNEAGGHCDPRWGNTCGFHPEHDGGVR